jgi:tetratricopeptide (TPR) repeat protein
MPGSISRRQQVPSPMMQKQMLEVWKAKFFELFFKRAYKEALPWGKKLMLANPGSASHIANVATCWLLIGDVEAALALYRRAHQINPCEQNVLDGLTHACGDLGLVKEARRFGIESLMLKDATYSASGLTPLLLPEQPAQGILSLVSFSLFGDNPRYCETAILNVEAVARLFPGWSCRFYVDATVPRHVIRRIVERGGEVVEVGGAEHAAVPGLMWRFLALGDPQVARVAFRDADSLVSERELGPVNDWVASGKSFHVMRDYHTHSELILAGMWGALASPLRDIRERMLDYLKNGGHPTHVDQHFLRACIWPLIKNDLISHDRVFGFHGALPLPELPRAKNGVAMSIGSDHAAKAMGASCNLPDGSRIEWTIVDNISAKVLCTYVTSVAGGAWSARIPLNLAQGIEGGYYSVHVRPGSQTVQ